jgi:hypothetical protein
MHVVAANNIAIDLAKVGSDPIASLKYLDNVLFSAKDSYSRTRAIIEKGAIVSKSKGYSELHPSDQELLNAAYSYSYSQRIGNLVDRCHKVLWTMYSRERLFAPLIRLFRFSSFTWLMGGNREMEGEYLTVMKTIDLSRLSAGDPSIEMEVAYVQGRLSELKDDESRAKDGEAG